jgi:hypothetical protein
MPHKPSDSESPCVRMPYFAPNGPRRPAQTPVGTAVGRSLLARRKPRVQIPPPPSPVMTSQNVGRLGWSSLGCAAQRMRPPYCATARAMGVLLRGFSPPSPKVHHADVHGPRAVRRLPDSRSGRTPATNAEPRVRVLSGVGAKPVCSALEPGRPTGEHWGSGGRLVAELGAS